MNEVVLKAKEIDEYNQYIPELEVGEIVEMNDLWDGKGDDPDSSYSYKLNDFDWICYDFIIIEEKENVLDTVIQITKIEIV